MPDNKPMQFHVPPGTRDLIKAYAARRFPVFSDYVRSLIEADMRAAGEDIDLGVSRGPRPVEGEVTPRVESEVRPQPDGYSTVLAFEKAHTLEHMDE